MRELRRVDAPSLRRVDEFLSRQTGASVRLGRVWLAPGALGRAVAAVAGASGITFGPLVCLGGVPADRLAHAEPGTPDLDALGSLLVHECVHVWQYAREGPVRFLARYLSAYVRHLAGTRRLDAEGRAAAYLAIPYEVEAYRLETAWLDTEASDNHFDIILP